MKSITKLNLSQLKICTLNSGLDENSEFSICRWNQRHVFPISSDMPHIMAQMTFSKDTSSDQPNKTGIRKKISILIANLDSGFSISETSFYVYLPKDTTHKTYTKKLEFEDSILYTDNNFRLIIINESDNQRIGYYDFYVSNFYESRDLKHNWVSTENAYISFDNSSTSVSFLSISPEFTKFPTIRFEGLSELSPRNFENEFEIRIYYPNGHIESSINTPTFPHYTNAETFHKITIMDNFTFQEYGVHYAELLYFGIPLSGFLFNVDDTEILGFWHELTNQFSPITDYTPKLGETLYKQHIKKLTNNNTTSHEIGTLFDFTDSDESIKKHTNQKATTNTPSCTTLCEISSWEKLDNLTGLKSVKEKLYNYKKLIDFTTLRKKEGLNTYKAPLHSIFLGSPGTGKTTVAKALGQMLAEAGVLSKGHVVVHERSTLLGRHYSAESENTLEAIKQAQGGILFIDEAYQLFAEDDPRDPGKYVFDTLLTHLADESNRDWMLILAGYPDKMRNLFNINLGLKSRIPESNIYTFDDFNEQELMEIAETYFANNQYTLSDDAREVLGKKFNIDYNLRDETFGNARYVMNIILTDIIPSMAARIANIPNPTPSDLSTILASDIPKPSPKIITKQRNIGFHA